MPKIILPVYGLILPVKRQRRLGLIKEKKALRLAVYKKHTLNIKTQRD